MPRQKANTTDQEALDFHAGSKPGKLEIQASKPMATQRDLSLAYSPGVAVPVRAIAEKPELAFEYTTKGNLVAVISNGTAILGLGNLGALASKPVMEGKAVLFKRFADIDSIDIELDTQDVDEFVNAVRPMAPSFGGINLEDIKAPECFLIETRLRDEMNIPVFHDDQHGTAIIAAAGIINALDLTGRKIEEVKAVVNGAGAAGIAVLSLLKSLGVRPENAILCDSKGVIYQGREAGMNQWKSAHAVETDARSLQDALTDADVFMGVSVKGALTEEMLKVMAKDPIIFAMANPDPEVTPEEAHAVRPDAIVATGRSDYPNQVNNVLGFPYIFRGALDVRATTINEEMKVAAVHAIANLAREDIPDEVHKAYKGQRLSYGRDYIIPAPFDPRLISRVPPAVAQAAMDSGVAQIKIPDMEAYRNTLSARMDPAASVLTKIMAHVRSEPKRVVFTEGEEEAVIRAAAAFQSAGLGEAILVGRTQLINEARERLGIDPGIELKTFDTRAAEHCDRYTDVLYERVQRKGQLRRDVYRLVRTDRNVFGACMVLCNDADAMVTGATRNFATAFNDIRYVVDPLPGQQMIGISMILAPKRAVFVADTSVIENPNAEELANIAMEAATVARRFGHEPRVAMLAYSTFGHPPCARSKVIEDAVAILDERGVDFEYEGEMDAHVALNPEGAALYPFSRLSGPANVLVMPSTHAASISTKILQELGGCTVLGPVLIGLERSIQIVQIGAGMNEILHMATFAAYDLNRGLLEE